ncbi:MAG: histidine phosphotransferase family protein [Pseudomonadota bacterium]
MTGELAASLAEGHTGTLRGSVAPPPAPDKLAALSGLVASRLCHDLVGPVGAIANGVDLIGELAGEAGPDDLAMVRQSTARTAALLEGLRLAFGAAPEDGQPRPRRLVIDTLTPVLAGRRVHFDTVGAEGPALPPPVAQLAALMVYAGRQVLGLQGAIQLVFSLDDCLPLRVVAEGPKAALSPEAAGWLAGDLADMPSSREVEMALLPLAAGTVGAVLTVEDADGAVSLVARRP